MNSENKSTICVRNNTFILSTSNLEVENIGLNFENLSQNKKINEVYIKF